MMDNPFIEERENEVKVCNTVEESSDDLYSLEIEKVTECTKENKVWHMIAGNFLQ